jgi:hypothetical protein
VVVGAALPGAAGAGVVGFAGVATGALAYANAASTVGLMVLNIARHRRSPYCPAGNPKPVPLSGAANGTSYDFPTGNSIACKSAAPGRISLEFTALGRNVL